MFRLTLRNLLARKLRLVMSGLSIVLGVAFLSGVLVFSNGLSSTFDGIIYGSTPDGVVRTKDFSEFDAGYSGTPKNVVTPETIEKLEALPEVDRADGDIAGFGMSLLASDGTLVGGTGAPTLAFNYHDGPNMDGGSILKLDSGHWPEATDEIVLDTAAAENGDYQLGDEVQLLAPYGEIEQTATLVGTAEFNGGGTAGATLLIFSTEGAQRLFLNGHDVYNRVSLTAAEGVTQEELADAAQEVIPDDFEAATGDKVADESQAAIGEFLGIISIFLLIFAGIAVLVSAFIILNTFTILVAQRSRELALLRALGAAREQVTRSVMLEALVLSFVASTIGIGVGWLLSRGLAALFRAIGLDIASNALDLTATAVGISYAVGVVVTIVAAYFPSRRAGRVAPVAAMRAESPHAPAPLGRRAAVGGVLLVVGAALAIWGVVGAPGPDALWVGIGAVIWILTVAVISPVIGKPVLVGCRALFGRLFGAPGRLAGENALRDPRRTGATASALMIGLALVSTIGVLAASMNKSIDDLVDEEFTADFLVQSTNFVPFSTTVGDALEDVDGVSVVSRQQWVGAKLDGDNETVAGNDDAFTDVYDLDVKEGRTDLHGSEAFVFDDFADDHDVSLGDELELSFPGGSKLQLEVVGIVGSSEVTAPINVRLDQIEKAGLTRQDTSVSILIEDGADAEAVQDDLDDAASDVPIVAVYDKEEFSDAIRDQVNQLLYIIYGLLALAIVIAVFGIVNTLGLSVIERTREVGLLRAIGMSRSRLRRMITLESVAIAVLGAVLGLGLGLTIGVTLRETLKEDLSSLALPLSQLVVFLAIAVVVGVLAAVIPSIRAARMNVLEAIAEE
ncbi:ABC transporter permease [Nocardioides bizhenqiangii]|uniref:FtsX-like permease family protein n=1 Tax=Nocardioides bizhenqiangii TaxID=3095076 RepID=A0ABZ0ZM46_9ACTN|nr:MULTISPECIES: FtsX-like permease family protein [unclassified Nocardioides]MDZ5620286.1 FtsX-like permease family protein [Nocardioides sp. HM23]WQQ24662.1 FtsX-like permease family protein [Nocardioides sp. HM61]